MQFCEPVAYVFILFVAIVIILLGETRKEFCMQKWPKAHPFTTMNLIEWHIEFSEILWMIFFPSKTICCMFDTGMRDFHLGVSSTASL